MLYFYETWDGIALQDGPDFMIGNLWDNYIHNVTSILPFGQTSLDIVLQSAFNCIGLLVVALDLAQS
jgi:hypothetical protein